MQRAVLYLSGIFTALLIGVLAVAVLVTALNALLSTIGLLVFSGLAVVGALALGIAVGVGVGGVGVLRVVQKSSHLQRVLRISETPLKRETKALAQPTATPQPPAAIIAPDIDDEDAELALQDWGWR